MENAFDFSDRTPPRPVPLHRLRRDLGGGRVDHFYTASEEERDEAVRRYGYVHEGVACLVWDRPTPSTMPLVRLYHGPTGCHSFSVRVENLEAARRTGTYRDEGAAGHVQAQAALGTVPLVALFHPATNAHRYDARPEERDAALTAGYVALSVVGWVLPAGD